MAIKIESEEIEYLKLKLQELISYRKELFEENVSGFDQLILDISDKLPAEYRSKINRLQFYEWYDPSIEEDDLPF